MKYKKKPVVIEAVQFNGDNHREVLSFVYPDMSEVGLRGAEIMKLPVVINTLEGDMTASVGDYIIKGVKGEFYPCKPDIFKQTYEAPCSSNMNFGQAIEALKDGKKVARQGWNGKGMFLWLKPAAEVKSEWCKDLLLKSLADENGGSISALGTICMYTHDSTGRKAILTGWLASQSDMLMEDWIIVE